MLDKEGVAGPADVSLIGDEAAVTAGVQALAATGATDFAAAVFAPAGHDAARTRELLLRLREPGPVGGSAVL